jgi:hypothetical protein
MRELSATQTRAEPSPLLHGGATAGVRASCSMTAAQWAPIMASDEANLALPLTLCNHLSGMWPFLFMRKSRIASASGSFRGSGRQIIAYHLSLT